MTGSRKIFPVLALAFALVCARARAQELADGIMSVVNEIPITQQQLVQFVGQDEEALYEQYHDQPEVLRRRILALRESASDFLINRQVILHDFQASIKVPDTIIDEYVNDRLNDMIRNKYHGQAGFTKELQAEGLTLDEFKQKMIREPFIIEQMRMKFVPEPIISPLKVENYYVAHRDDFKVEDQVKMRMLALNKTSAEPDEETRKRAGEILSQVRGGASFSELARSYSDGSTRQEGGETGWEELSIVNKTLAQEINRLKPGQISGVVETPTAFYVLLLEDRKPAHFKSLNEVRVQIERTLASIETDRLQRAWIDRLRKKTFVKNFAF
jgi:peptidyl-prolyl cis-trans isomerase SurA